MKGEIALVAPNSSVFAGKVKVKNDGKLRRAKLKATGKDTPVRKLEIELCSNKPDSMTVGVRPSEKRLIIFDLVSDPKNTNYLSAQGRDHPSGQYNAWSCTLKVK